MDFTQEGSEALLRNAIITMAEQLIPPAAVKIGIKTDELKSRIKKVSVIKNTEVNGHAYSSDNWKTFRIEINSGLMMFLHHMVKLFVSGAGVAEIEASGRVKKVLERSSISFEKQVSVANNLMKAYWDNALEKQRGFYFMDLSNNQIKIGGGLLHNAEHFAVAHEFGHIIIKTSSQNINELNVGLEMMRRISSDIPALTNNNVIDVIVQWGEEIAADIIGMQLLLEVIKEDLRKILSYTAIELVFIVQHMLDTFYEKYYAKPRLYNMHPPAYLRLIALRSLLRDSNPSQLFHGGMAFEQIANSIIKEAFSTM